MSQLTAVRLTTRQSDQASVITLEFGDHVELSVPIPGSTINRVKIDPGIKIILESVTTE